jgi:Flp pilus assembly protein TadD
MRWLACSSIGLVVACAGAPSTSNCEVLEPEPDHASAEASPSDEEALVYARWLARGDAHDFEWLEWRIHLRLEQNPRDLARWAELARLHVDRSVRDEDPSALRRVALILADADRIGESAEIELVRGLFEQLEGRPDRAVVAWQRAIDLDPMHSEARLRLGIACLEHRDFARAREQLEIFVELEPENADGWLALGVAHARVREREAARTAYLRAAELAPEDPRPHWNLAWMSQDWTELEDIWAVQEELQRSREHLAELFATDRQHPVPDCEPVFFQDPQCLAAIEQRRELIDRAIELDATNREAIDALDYLNRRPSSPPRLSEQEKRIEAERRRELLEMEKAAMEASQEVEREAQLPPPG